MPVNIAKKDNIIAFFRPLASETMLINTRPMNAPKLNIDWMVSLAHYKSQ